MVLGTQSTGRKDRKAGFMRSPRFTGCPAMSSGSKDQTASAAGHAGSAGVWKEWETRRDAEPGSPPAASNFS